MAERDDAATPAVGSPGRALRLLGAVVRLSMVLPILATGAASLGLMLFGTFETVVLLDALRPSQGTKLDQAMLMAIKIVDLFLLSTVVQVVSLGLYQLYFDPELELPRWLKISTLDDLKSKLLGVVVTVLAVHFLGQALVWEGTVGIAWLGGGIAVMIGALTLFLQQMGQPRD